MSPSIGWVFVDVADGELAALLLDVFREADIRAIRVETDRLPPPALVVTTLEDRTAGLFPGVSEIILLPIEEEEALRAVVERRGSSFIMGRPMGELAQRVRSMLSNGASETEGR